MAEKLSLKSMPHNAEAELSVLGCALIDNDTINVIREIIAPNDFYQEKNKAVYTAMLSLFDKRSSIDTITLANELIEKEVFDKIGGHSLLTEIMDSVYSTSNVEDYCEIIKENSVRRKLIRDLGTVIDKCYDKNDNAGNIVDLAQKYVYDISVDSSKSEFISISEAVKDALNEINRIQKLNVDVIGVPSGYKNIDDVTSGFQKGDFVLLAARPSMGKTALAVNIAQNAAIRYGKSVAVFSLEMPVRQLANRIISGEAKVNSMSLRVGNVQQSEWGKLYNSLSNIRQNDVKLFINDLSGISVGELRRKCRKLKASEGLDMIVIDYLQLMTINERTDSRQQEISAISRNLKAIAKELDVPVLALSQLSRGPEGRENKRPRLSDLRESGAIEQDADLVMLLYREKYYNKESEDNSTEVIIAKHRNGETKTVKLQFEEQYTSFVDYVETPTDGEAYFGENLN